MPTSSLRRFLLPFLICALTPSSPVAAQVDVTPADKAIGIHGEYLPEGFLEALRLRVREGHWINRIAFPHYGDGWLFTFGRNGFAGDRLPDDMYARLLAENRQGAKIGPVAFRSENEWVITFGSMSINGFLARGIPEGLEQHLRRINREDGAVGMLALPGFGSWLVYERNQRIYGGGSLPVIERIQNAGGECEHWLSEVTTLPNGAWLFVCGQNAFSSSGAPVAMLDAIHRIRARKNAIEAVAFAPYGGWVVVEDR